MKLKSDHPQKRCPHCGNLFTPYKRAVNTQKTCKRISCIKKHKKKIQATYLKKNPYVFRGQYVQTKNWLKKHPGYLAAYRAATPEYVRRDNEKHKLRRRKKKKQNADIQVGLLRRRIAKIRHVKCADIQVGLKLQLDGILDLLNDPRAPIYKLHGQLRC